MAKTPLLCPFSSELCNDHMVYRGRRYYLNMCKKYGGHISQPKGTTNPNAHYRPIDFEALKRTAKPWTDAQDKKEEGKLEVTLKVVDMESGARGLLWTKC